MERQLTVRMPVVLANKLERVARRMGRKRSEVVRLVLQQFLEDTSMRGHARPVDLVRDLLGSLESGVPDLGQRHRDHLLRRLRRDR
jgi:hypothetical protein